MKEVRSRDELSNHLNNVLTVISDKVIPHSNGSGGVDYFLADIRQASDYSPFGVQLEGRNLLKTGVSKDYRYSVQGQEHIDEVQGEGHFISFNYRNYDPLIGRMWSIDPLSAQYPYNSPYAFSENRVLDGIELEGLEVTLLKDHQDNYRQVAGPVNANFVKKQD